MNKPPHLALILSAQKNVCYRTQMAQALAQTLPLPAQPSSATYQPVKMSWWYHSIIDFMMANPQATKKEMADHFKVAEITIHYITNSDIFRAHFAARRERFSEVLDASIHRKLSLIADKSLGILADVLERKGDNIPLMQIVEVQEKVLDRLGYGVKPQVAAPPPVAEVHVHNSPVAQQTNVTIPVSASDLEAARVALRRSEQMKLVESSPLDDGRREPSFEGRTALEGACEPPIGDERGPDEPSL